VADIALDRACPQCGTLVTCPGSFTDEVLVGSCSRCALAGIASTVEIKNPRFVHPIVAENEALHRALDLHEKSEENQRLRKDLEQKDAKAAENLDTSPQNLPPSIDMGKHDPELTNKYHDNTGSVSNAAEFATDTGSTSAEGTK
jgi:hypothetical protein